MARTKKAKLCVIGLLGTNCMPRLLDMDLWCYRY